MGNDVLVSVYCATFNHENYIAEALDSILMQKVDFPIEILVGEDCSTDKTREILKKYEENHPGRLTVFYRDHNMYKEVPNNGLDLKMRCRGKYVIALEGDDFWIDENKLQKQADFLENHSDYIAVAHNCVVVDKDSNPTGELFRECKQTEYTFSHYASEIMPGQTATFMARNAYKDHLFDLSFMDFPVPPGDRRMYFTYLAHGRIYCIQESMSAYRHIVTGGSSYSANLRHDFSKSLKWHEAQLTYAMKVGNPEAIKCAELMYCLTVRDGMKRREISIRDGLKKISMIGNKTYFSMAKRDINRFILHKELDI